MTEPGVIYKENPQHLELRRKVAEALGCTAVLRAVKNSTGTGNIYLFCECEGADRFNPHSEWVNGKLLVLPYDTDRHAAMDALVGFCEKNDLEAVTKFRPKDEYVYVALWDWENESAPFLSSEVEDALPLAICRAIVEAKRVIDERGEGN